MKTLTLILLVMVTIPSFSQNAEEVSEKIISLEKKALERWNNGDVYGYLHLYAPEITYFDPMLDKRMDGLDELTAYYEPIQGKISTNSYEMIDPLVRSVDDMAVLTYNFRANTKERTSLWNCTEVYEKEKNGDWKIIHSHWSLTKPELK